MVSHLEIFCRSIVQSHSSWQKINQIYREVGRDVDSNGMQSQLRALKGDRLMIFVVHDWDGSP